MQSDDNQSHDTHLVPEENSILRNLIVKCRKEMEDNCLHKPLEDYVERVAYYTDMSKEKINHFMSIKLKDIDYENKYFELSHRIGIFKCLEDLCINKQIPTLINLFTLLNDLNKDIDIFQFQYMLNCLGFEYRKLQSGKQILIEDPELTFDRFIYLKQIKDLKAKGAPIYYIDERFVDSSYTFPKPWMKNIDISSDACDGYVFFHAVSKKGFQNGFFCSPTTKIDFTKWVTHILLPQLTEPSVIVMDRNELHRCNVDEITKYHSKDDMLQYLKKTNIPFSEKLHKAELYKLITQCSARGIYNNIEEIINAHGHQVLWLPSTFQDLSITHFLWKYMVEFEQTTLIKASPKTIKKQIFRMLVNIPLTLWESFHEDLSKMEKCIFDIDSQLLENMDKNYI